ncbi:MAG: hypothetical protein JXR91_03455 [Deltaproteobacteria bacterium]|nr:hypothetical protein [Deltaproteobacteria bacterium]
MVFSNIKSALFLISLFSLQYTSGCGDGNINFSSSNIDSNLIFENSSTDKDSSTDIKNVNPGIDTINVKDSNNETETETLSTDNFDTETTSDTENVIIKGDAENFDILDNNGLPLSWAPVYDTDTISSTADGGIYITTVEDTAITDTDSSTPTNISNPANSCQIGYYIDIPAPGRYYVWVRGYSGLSTDNSIHTGFDNTWPASGKNIQFPQMEKIWVWSSNQRDSGGTVYGIPYTIYLDIDTPGKHSLMFAMREDGFKFDSWIISSSDQYNPND